MRQAANEIETASDAAEEAQAGVEMTAVTEHEGRAEELDSVMVEKGQETHAGHDGGHSMPQAPMLQVVTRIRA